MRANTEGREFVRERALDIAGDFLLKNIQEIAGMYGKGMDQDRDNKIVFEAILADVQVVAQGLIDQGQGMQLRRVSRGREHGKTKDQEKGNQPETTPAWIEAIAALLYNEIYELSGDEEGAWTLRNKAYDSSFYSLAEGLLHAFRNPPEPSDATLLAYAEQYAREHNPSWSDVIVIDQEDRSLIRLFDNYMPIVRDFLDNPARYPEGEFLAEVK